MTHILTSAPHDTDRPVHDLSSDELHTAAVECAKSANGKRHWSRIAAILGRINDEQLYATHGYANMRAYTSLVMKMPQEEVFESLRLWKLMQTASADVPITEWDDVPKIYAVEIRKLVALGASPREWIQRARHAASFTEFYAEVCKRLDKEQWVTITVRAPKSLAESFENCLVVALPEATCEPLPDPERIHDRGTRFLALEVILRNFAHTYVHGSENHAEHSG